MFQHWLVLAMLAIIYVYQSKKGVVTFVKESLYSFLSAIMVKWTKLKRLREAEETLWDALYEAHGQWIYLRRPLDHYAMHPEDYAAIVNDLEDLKAMRNVKVTPNSRQLLRAMDDLLGTSTDRVSKWDTLYHELVDDVTQERERVRQEKAEREAWNDLAFGWLGALSGAVATAKSYLCSSSSSWSDEEQVGDSGQEALLGGIEAVELDIEDDSSDRIEGNNAGKDACPTKDNALSCSTASGDLFGIGSSASSHEIV